MFKPCAAPHIPNGLLDLINAAQLQVRSAARRCLVHAFQ